MLDSENEIMEIVAKQLQIADVASIKADLRLREDLGADDLDVIDIILAAAEHPGVKIADEEFDNVIILSDIVRIIESAKKKVSEKVA